MNQNQFNFKFNQKEYAALKKARDAAELAKANFVDGYYDATITGAFVDRKNNKRYVFNIKLSCGVESHLSYDTSTSKGMESLILLLGDNGCSHPAELIGKDVFVYCYKNGIYFNATTASREAAAADAIIMEGMPE